MSHPARYAPTPHSDDPEHAGAEASVDDAEREWAHEATPRAHGLDPALVEALLSRVRADGARTLALDAPATGEPFATVPLSSTADVADAVARSRAVQRTWAARTVRQRTAVLARFHDLLLERRSDVLDVVQVESGKARLHAFEEIVDVAGHARHLRARAGSYLRPRSELGVVPGLISVRVHHRPLGVVGIISPWNFPLCLPVGDALAALVAGNGVVIKPDTRTSLATLLAVDLLEEAGLPEGLVQVVVGDGDVGAALVGTADAVCFTGSTRTGRTVAAQAAERLVPTVLELGGKNALYVTEDVDVEAAAEGAVRACFTGAGQVCVSIERIYVHEAVAQRFTGAFVRRTGALALGAGLDYTSQMGSLTTSDQLATVTEHVSDALARGARVLAGGVHRPDLGPLFYEPTILDRLPDDAIAASEETFGPVVALTVVAGDDEAATRMNDSAYGLSASVWTRSAGRGRALAERIEAGLVTVNEGYVAAWGSSGAPVGGWKDSGLGSRHGKEGLLVWTRPQTVAVQRAAHAGRSVPTPALALGRIYSLPGHTVDALFTAAMRTLKFLRAP